jgi:SAM-dependent methyltransferase/uncharacterized protein YbaR (Trm112 family)
VKTTLLDQLQCPAGTPSCGGPLTAEPWQVEEHTGSTDIREGTLSCDRCTTVYYIVGGVAILLEALPRYLNDHLPVLRRLAAHGAVSAVMINTLSALAGDPADGPHQRRSDRLEERYTHAFLGAHYDAAPAADAHPLVRAMLEVQAHSGLWTMIQQQLDTIRPSRVLDIGCSVGGVAATAAANGSTALGIDTSFLSIYHARRVNLGTPNLMSTYRAYAEGDRFTELPLETPCSPDNDIEFIVASATDRVTTHAYDLICAVNLIDVVPEPGQLLSGLAADIPPGGRMLLTTPYGWSNVPRRNWLGGTSAQSSSEAVREELTALGLSLEWENREVPWVWRDYTRFWRACLVDAMVFRRPINPAARTEFPA